MEKQNNFWSCCFPYAFQAPNNWATWASQFVNSKSHIYLFVYHNLKKKCEKIPSPVLNPQAQFSEAKCNPLNRWAQCFCVSEWLITTQKTSKRKKLEYEHIQNIQNIRDIFSNRNPSPSYKIRFKIGNFYFDGLKLTENCSKQTCNAVGKLNSLSTALL